MDPKQSQDQEKMQVLVAHIEKQLTSGTPPKELHADLIARKVPHALAVELIEKQVSQQKTPSSPSPAHAGGKPTRQERIRAFINAQAHAGKTADQIRGMLVERNVSHQEAADLILEETGLAVSTLDTRGRVAATLPMEPVPAMMPPIGNLRALAPFLSRQLAGGVEPKELVESLVEKGMERNAAIDVVMDASQKQERVLREIAASSEGATKADMRKRGLRNMLIGGALFLGGSCITLVSFLSAEDGGTYWLFYGPIIYGLISGIMGLVQFLRN